MTSLTDYHAKYFAYELTKRSASDSVEKLAGVLADAQVDLNPHQIEAALFAFRNPFSRGAILADEVGLGKTIEAGLLLAQRWAERKRKLLVIVPANLRKQWSQELLDKFFLPSMILENRTFNEEIRKGNLNPFAQSTIVLCSYQFARAKEMYVRQVPWDLVVVDEAHRLRNVYKPSNKIANAIKLAVSAFPKVLLTATPLQNSLLELYGLVSIIDDYLQNETELTRSTLARVLRESGRLGDFLVNPQRFMDHAAAILKYELHRLLVDGIKYDRIQGTGAEAEWEMVLFKNEELVNLLTALQVNKSIYDYVSYDSEIEREFAQKLDQREDIRLFVKLPDWFKVDTPVGTYNPDWAIVKHEDETIYLVRETKGTKDFLKLRTVEADKVRCGQRHFDALGVSFAVAVTADEI